MRLIRIVILTVICLIISLNIQAEEKKQTSASTPKEDYYTVKKGDTLWSISQKLLKSPWRWKILWDQNKDVPIPNPNLIYPGQRLKLIATATPAPAPAKLALTPAASSAPPAPLPEEVIQSEPYVQPESQPVAPAYYLYSPINIAGFIRKEQSPSEGLIMTVKGNKNNISAGDMVYIREQKEKPLTIGKRYTIFRPLTIKDGHKFIGIQHLFTGVVEIMKREEQAAIGKIIESYRPILKDDMLMPYSQRSPRILLSQSRKGIEGILFLSEENSRVCGEYTVAFINKGEKDGIAIGQTYSVCEPVKDVNESSQKTVSILEIGSVLVVHVEKEISTVLITKSDKDIYAGSLIRTPSEIR